MLLQSCEMFYLIILFINLIAISQRIFLRNMFSSFKLSFSLFLLEIKGKSFICAPGHDFVYPVPGTYGRYLTKRWAPQCVGPASL